MHSRCHGRNIYGYNGERRIARCRHRRQHMYEVIDLLFASAGFVYPYASCTKVWIDTDGLTYLPFNIATQAAYNICCI